MKIAYFILIAWIFLFGIVLKHHFKTMRAQSAQAKNELQRKGSVFKKRASSRLDQESQKRWASYLENQKVDAKISEKGEPLNLNSAIEHIKDYYQLSDISDSPKKTSQKDRIVESYTDSTDSLSTIKNFYKLIDQE